MDYNKQIKANNKCNKIQNHIEKGCKIKKIVIRYLPVENKCSSETNTKYMRTIAIDKWEIRGV